MSLPIQSIVDVNVSISPTVPPRPGFGIAAMVSSESIIGGGLPPNRVTFYASMTEIAVDWLPTDEVYLSATAYFGQQPSPVSFAVISQDTIGSETIVDALDAAEAFSSLWYGVLLQAAARDAQDQLDVAAWAQSRVKMFSACTNNANSLVLGDIDNNAFKLMNSVYDRTICTYSSDSTQYPDAAVFGRAFTVNYDAPESVITLKFKPLSGILTENISTNQKAGLDEKRCNAHISVAGTSMYAEGYMSAQLFFDERHGVDWLTGEIENNVFAYLISRPTKVPLTDAGASSLQQQVIRALDTAVLNGLLGAGTIIDGTFLGNGYVTNVQRVADMDPTDKANRIAPTISFTALLAGAVHFVQINGVVER